MIALSTSAFYEQANRQIGSLRSQAETLQQQVGSGNRLTHSSDDPVAAARLRALDRADRLSQIDQRSADKAGADLQLTDSALGSIADIIARAQELALSAASGTLSTDQRTAIGSELEGMQQSLLVVANARDSAGHALFGGQTAGAAYGLAGGTFTYQGTDTVAPLDLGEGQSVTPALTGPEVLAFNQAGQPGDLFAVLGTLAAAMATDTAPDAARSALDGLGAALDKVTTAQAVVGSRIGLVELLNERRTDQAELSGSERDSVGGADLATSITRLQQVMTVLEASQASFVRLSSLSLFQMLR